MDIIEIINAASQTAPPPLEAEFDACVYRFRRTLDAGVAARALLATTSDLERLGRHFALITGSEPESWPADDVRQVTIIAACLMRDDRELYDVTDIARLKLCGRPLLWIWLYAQALEALGLTEGVDQAAAAAGNSEATATDSP